MSFSDECAHCDQGAVCVNNHCVCKPENVGDGLECAGISSHIVILVSGNRIQILDSFRSSFDLNFSVGSLCCMVFL